MYQNPESLFGGAAPLLDLIEQIYASMSDPSLWPGILDRISHAARGRQTFMFTDTPDPAMPRSLIGTETDPEILAKFLSHYAAINVFAEPADAAFREGEIRYSHWLVPDRELERTEFYNDFFLPYDMHWSYGVKVPVAEGATPVYISCQRPRSQPAFSRREGEVLRVLLPHIQRAFAMHRQFALLQARIGAFESALDAFDHAVFGLAANSRVVASNRAAEQLARAGGALRIVHGRLRAASAQHDLKLQSLIAAVLGSQPGPRPFSAAMLVPQLAAPALRLTLLPAGDTPLPAPRTAAVLVLVSDPARKPRSRASILQALYGLTPTENRVAELLAQGLDVRAVAARLGLAHETARFHVKRIFARTGVRRQAELLRLILALPGWE